MPRYEFIDDKSKKFWEISIAGTNVTARWGRIGSDGQTKTKSFDGEEQAQKEYDKQIAGKVKKGYALAGDETSEAPPAASATGASNPALEAVIRESPNDSDAYLVYGDWLQAEGEALGELVSIQHALAKDPSNTALRSSEESLLLANREYFFGPEQPHADNEAPKFQEINKWSKPNDWDDKSAWNYSFTSSVWRNGFVHKLIFDTGYYGDEEYFGKDAGAILSKVLALPAARFVQHISIGEIWMEDDYEGPDTTYAVDAVAQSPCASTLVEFHVTGGDHDLNGVSLDATSLFPACPNLETVVLYAGQLTIGPVEGLNKAGKIKRFAAQTGGMDAGNLKAIAKAKWPALEDLEIWFGEEEYGCNCSFSDVEPILGRTDLKLKRLGIMNMGFGDEVCSGLVSSPLLPGLSHLNLTKGVIGEEGAKAILDNKDKFAHLETFEIAGYWSSEIANSLKAICEGAKVETRGPADDDYRYVEVGE